jgi:hypothetical protein
LKRSATILDKRAETDFYVDIVLEDQCGAFLPESPSLQSGDSPCQLDFYNTGVFEYACQYPGANSPEAVCEETVTNALSTLTGGFIGSSTDWQSAAETIALYIPGEYLAVILAGIGAIAAVLAPVIEGLVLAIGFLAIIQIVLSLPFISKIVAGACTLLHSEKPMIIYMAVLGQSSDLAIVTAAPVTHIATTVRVSDPSVTCYAPCNIAGYCGSYQPCGPPGDICGCSTDSTGATMCALDRPCSNLTACSSSAPCDDGLVCFTDTCCGPGVCVDPAPCLPPGSLKRQIYDTTGISSGERWWSGRYGF